MIDTIDIFADGRPSESELIEKINEIIITLNTDVENIIAEINIIKYKLKYKLGVVDDSIR